MITGRVCIQHFAVFLSLPCPYFKIVLLLKMPLATYLKTKRDAQDLADLHII